MSEVRMTLKPWGELSVNEKHKFSIQARRNPRKAYEKLCSDETATPQPETSAEGTE